MLKSNSWLNRYSIAQQLWILIASFVFSLLLLGGVMTATLKEVQVGGPIFKQVADGKDLVADILPPPAYLIEAWQVTLELAVTSSPKDKAVLVAKSHQLRKDFDAREVYWQQVLTDGKLKEVFLKGAYPAGRAFLNLRDQAYLPAIERNDVASAQALLPKLKALYLAHRAKIDEVVEMANARVTGDEASAHDVINSRSITLVGVGCLLLVVIMWLGQAIAKQVKRSIGGDLREAARVVANVASGDLESKIPLVPQDTQSLMFNLQRMQSSLLAAQRQARENARIRRALDAVSSNVRITDEHGIVLYANQKLHTTIKQLEVGIRQKLPSFQASQFIGMDITKLYDDTMSDGRSAQSLRQERTSLMNIGGRTFEVKTAPVFDEQQQLIGTIGEWHDQTDLLKVQEEVRLVIDAAKQGHFNQRISVNGKDGFFLTLSESMNTLLASTESALAELGGVLSALANGDLTVKMHSQYEGMLAQLKEDCNQTIDQLAEIVSQISYSTNSIHSASQEIATGNLDFGRRTEKQAASIEETAASMEELTGNVKKNAENAHQANELASGASIVAGHGGEAVENVVSTMNEINQSARKIVDIISVIDGIAFQTNILALNAAVEAARAGEQGKGFAVVASEVRGLAQRSATAAKEIKNLINDSVSKTDSGTKLVNQAGETIKEVVVSVKRVTDIMGEITEASAEQSAGIQHVNQTVSQMDAAIQQNASLVEEASTAASSLKEQAENLQQLVSRFKLTVNNQVNVRGNLPRLASLTVKKPVGEQDSWASY